MGIFLMFLRAAWPLLMAAAAGAWVAWHIQGLRLDAAHAAFDEYKIAQKKIVQAEIEKQDKRREATALEWSKKYDRLQQDSDLFKRCVAAGKCGRLQYLSGCPSLKVQAASGADDSREGAVPAAGGHAAEMISPVLRDCAADVLKLNLLQADIERQ